MAPPPGLAQLLLELAQHAAPLADADSLEDFQRAAKDVCRACSLSPGQLAAARPELAALCASGWQQLADEGVAVAEATKTLNALMRYGAVVPACTAAALYSALLCAPEAPVHSMLDALTLSGCLQRIKEAAFASGAGAKGGKGRGAKASQQSQSATAGGANDQGSSGEDEPADPSSGRPAAAAADLELALCLCHEALGNLAATARAASLRNCEEVLQAALEGCTDLLGCAKVAKVPAGSKGLGLSAGSISAAAYALLDGLFSPRHGSMADMAAALLPRLTPLMAGAAPAASGKRSAAEAAALRSAAAEFVRGAYSRHPEVQESVAALARHVCLRAPDKADCRAAAVKTCAELVADLPQWVQEQFVGFVLSLSRTKQLGLRTLSVSLANALLMNLPEPFKHSTFVSAASGAAAALGGGQQTALLPADGAQEEEDAAPARAAAAPPPGMAVAPWSVVALAALLHRCSDKSAVVRSRALTDLSEVVDCFASLLAEDPESEQHQVAAAFVEGLNAAAALQVPQPAQAAAQHQRAAKRKAAGGRGGGDGGSSDSEGDDDDDYDPARRRGGRGRGAGAGGSPGGDARGQEAGSDAEQGGGPVGGDQPAQQRLAASRAGGGAFVAFMPARLSADLAHITSLVHRRCGDSKAAVRRAALQLLEVLLVMRASWRAYPRQLPGSADVALLEAATADPLVSVRKAALVALSTLLELFPSDQRLCHAWVASGLPLVRDVEASIQDALVEWSAALLFDKAAAVGAAASGRGKKGGKNAAAAAADSAQAGEDMDWQAEGDGGGGEAGGTLAATAFAELRPLLAAVLAVGRAAGACLGKLCAAMAAKKKLKASAVARGLEAVIAGTPAGSQAALGAWVLLRELAAHDPSAPSWHFLQQRWAAVRETAAGGGAAAAQAQAAGEEAHSAPGGAAEEAASLLLVISHTAAGFPRDQAEGLSAELLQHILSFQLPPAAAGAHVAALFKLTEAIAGQGGGGGGAAAAAAAAGDAQAQWARQVFKAAHEQLRRYIDARSAAVAAAAAALDHVTCSAVFTVGEVALLRAAKPPGGLTVLLQALTARAFIPAAGAAAADGGGASQQPPSQGEAGEAGEEAAAGASGGGGGGGGRGVPACVQAHAWISLGKTCLADEQLAKKCVPLFVQELGRSWSPVVRNNIMVALSDMLVHYTSLVDAHMHHLAACIRDRHELVRRQALALLANLLMKDYVKWRGALFHRFLLALVDPSPAVRQLATYLLGDTLATKAPLLAYNHFVEAVFVLNGCTAGLHGARVGASLAGGGRAAPQDGGAGAEEDGEGGEALSLAPAQFMLRGRQNRAARGVIYSSLLRCMSPEHKFSTAAKLVAEVLAGVADGLLPLGECEEVLHDALVLMASKDIKVSASRLAAQDEEELVAPGAAGGAAAGAGSATAAEAAARARGKLVSALMKRHLVEQVVPVLVELRRLLAEAKHPLLGELMSCFAALLKEHKAEVEDILVADKQLAKEILFDMKQAELTKQQQQQAAASAAATGPAGDDAAGAAAPPRPAGVMPGTPLAAEVLATAERQRREQQQQQGAEAGGTAVFSPQPLAGLRTPGGLAGGGAAQQMLTPATAAGGASRSRLSHGSGAAAGPVGALKTPAAKTPGSVLGPGVRGALASPAPLSLPKGGPRATRGARAAGGGGDENTRPPAAGASAGAPSVSQAAAQRLRQLSPPAAPTNVLLPSPYHSTPARQWNIPQHVATGEKPPLRKSRAAVAAAQEEAESEPVLDGEEAAAAAAAGSRRRGRASSKQQDASRPPGRAAAEAGAGADGSPEHGGQAAAPAGGRARAAASRRATRAGEVAAAVTVKVEAAAAAGPEAGARRAGTRKRRNA